jgi:hypothetical protein
MHLGALFRLNFSCALLPMVSSPFASPWGVGNFGAFYLGCVEPLPLSWSLACVFFFRFFSFSLFSELVTRLCCQCTHQGGDWGPERPRIGGWSLLAVMSDWQRGVEWLLAEYCRCRLRLHLH